MNLVEQVNSDVVTAMKNKDKISLDTLRMLKSALQMEKISKKHDLSDEEAILVIKKQVKTRKESIEEYKSYGKDDLVENLNKEIAVLSVYLPEELTEDEINKELDIIFAELKPESLKDLGLVMKSASAKLGAKADMKTVSRMIKERLSWDLIFLF